MTEGIVYHDKMIPVYDYDYKETNGDSHSVCGLNELKPFTRNRVANVYYRIFLKTKGSKNLVMTEGFILIK